MAKLPRKLMKLFGSAVGTNEVAQFGSLAAAAPVFVNDGDPDTIQALPAWIGGWYDAVIGGNSPAIQDMNALQYVFAYQLAYLMQAGVPEWNTDTVYYIGSLVNDGTGQFYISRTDNNTSNALTDGDNWTPMGNGYTTDVFPGSDVVVVAGKTLTYFNLDIEVANLWTVAGSLVSGNMNIDGTLDITGSVVILF